MLWVTRIGHTTLGVLRKSVLLALREGAPRPPGGLEETLERWKEWADYAKRMVIMVATKTLFSTAELLESIDALTHEYRHARRIPDGEQSLAHAPYYAALASLAYDREGWESTSDKITQIGRLNGRAYHCIEPMKFLTKLGPAFGFIAEDDNEIIFPIRGTKTSGELVQQVLMGFLRRATINSFYTKAAAALGSLAWLRGTIHRNHIGNRRLVLIGHSMGGALATIMALFMPEDLDAAAFTFGAPAVMVPGLDWSELSVNVRRFVAPGDAVPYFLPKFWGHPSPEIFLAPGSRLYHLDGSNASAVIRKVEWLRAQAKGIPSGGLLEDDSIRIQLTVLYCYLSEHGLGALEKATWDPESHDMLFYTLPQVQTHEVRYYESLLHTSKAMIDAGS